MKNLFLIALFAFSAGTAFAQWNYSVDKVDPANVPQSVLDTHNEAFPDKTVSWELHTGTGKNKSKSQYVAIFRERSSSVRARYTIEGVGISATTYYRGINGIPEVVKDGVANKYPDFTLKSAEKIYSFKKDDLVYRARLHKGAAKLVVYLDAEGNIIEKDDVPEEVKEDEGEKN